MEIKEGSLFRVTEDHLKLIKSAYFDIPRLEDPRFEIMQVNQKRPFGDSDILKSMAVILGKSYTEDLISGTAYVDGQESNAWFDQMAIGVSIALECCCKNLRFEPRAYRYNENYKWEPVE